MKIIALDPSLVNTGIVRLEGRPGSWTITKLRLVVTKSEQSTIPKTTPKSKIKPLRKNYDDLERARKLWTALQEEFVGVDYVCAEIPQIGGADMQARSMWTSGIALGLLATIQHIPVISLTPKEVKEVTGNAKASKEEMCQWAYTLYPDAPWPTRKYKGNLERLVSNHHMADALAAGVAGLTRQGLWLAT